MALLLFDPESFKFFLELFPIEWLEAEDRSVYVKRRHDAAAAVRAFYEPRSFWTTFDGRVSRAGVVELASAMVSRAAGA